MLGAIAGDIIGSVFEAHPIKSTRFPLFTRRSHFTDDTVLTVATAHVLLTGGDYAAAYRRFGRAYPRAGYGGSFVRWLGKPDAAPYYSWGNGAAMRVSPVGFAMDSIEAVLAEAEKSAAVTHNHPEGVKGAQATALAVFLARRGESKETIRSEISRRFGYRLDRRLDRIRPDYSFDVSCQGSVPEAMIAFFESRDLEDAIRLAISLGGDSDTLACIAGGIAHAFYAEIPPEIRREVEARLPDQFLQIIDEFTRRFMNG